MKKFEENVYFNRDKEDNWDIIDKAYRQGFDNPDNLAYLGYDIQMKVEINESGDNVVLEINGIDVSDKDITI